MKALLTLIIFIPLKAKGFFDAIVDQAEKIAEASALTHATIEILSTAGLDKNSEIFSTADELSKRFNQLDRQTKEALLKKEEFSSIFKIPDFSHKTLTESLNNSNNYLKRVQSLLLSLAAFPKVSQAYSQLEGVFALQEQLKIERALLNVQTETLTHLQWQSIKEEVKQQEIDQLVLKEFKKRRGL